MYRTFACLLAALATAFFPLPASAWYHAYGWGSTSAYHGSYGGYHPAWGYHPPSAYHATAYGTSYHSSTTVNYYGSSCHSCGGWNTAGAALAGAAVGVVAGTAIANANARAAEANAYSAGYSAGAANAYEIGAIYATVPHDCVTPIVGGETYYMCGNTWFKPKFGANGVYYKVVPPP